MIFVNIKKTALDEKINAFVKRLQGKHKEPSKEPSIEKNLLTSQTVLAPRE